MLRHILYASGYVFSRIVLNKLHVVADYEGRSANSQILILIRDCIEKYEDKFGKIELESNKK